MLAYGCGNPAVANVAKGGPAAQAGIKQGDVVLTYRGKDIADASALRNAVATTPTGQEVQVTVMRSGQKQVLTATVRSLDEATTALLSAVKERLGVDVRPVTTQEEERYGLESQQGVTITWLEPRGSLERAGLEVRDILLAIDDQPIESMEWLSELASTAARAADHHPGPRPPQWEYGLRPGSPAIGVTA